MKGGIPIANVDNTQNVTTADDSHYQIDRSRYSLIISPTTINDTSTDYQCDLFVLNPVTNVLQVLQPSTPVTLSLKVIGMLISQDFIQWVGGGKLPPPPPRKGKGKKEKRREKEREGGRGGKCACFWCYDILDHFKTRQIS